MPLIALSLVGCLAVKGGLSIGEAPTELSTTSAEDPRWLDLTDCYRALDEAQCEAFKSAGQTWSVAQGIEAERIRLVITGDTGKRYDDSPDRPVRDAQLVQSAAQWACGSAGCDGAVFLGDNLYQKGIDGPVDTAFLRNYTQMWLEQTVEQVYYSQGNHDWGPMTPDRDRGQRLHRDIHHTLGDQVHGASHFWHAQLGPLRLASLDSNWFVRQCDAEGGHPSPLSEDGIADWSDRTVDCGDDLDWLAAMDRVLGDAGKENTVAVAHHGWFNNGKHGTAGWFRDIKSFTLGYGSAWRAVLERSVRPRASLFLAGHDHQVGVHLDAADPATLSVIVGSGSKVSAPGDRTADGERFHQSGMVLEAHCHLGFALIDRAVERFTVDVYSLKGSHWEACSADIDKRRGPHAANRGQRVDGAPAALTEADLTCRRFELTDGAWQPALCPAPLLE